MTADFNEYNDSYAELLQDAVAFSGAEAEMFMRKKARCITNLASQLGETTDLDVLDVGCGAGETERYLKGSFARLTGVDIAPDPLERAAKANPWASYEHYNAGDPIPFPSASFDLSFAICVLHHVPPPERRWFVAEMARVTRAGGIVAIFEHNPFNPLTRIVVHKCSFDEDAVLLSRRHTMRLLKHEGLRVVAAPYIIFFTREGQRLERIERSLRGLPFGAQYYVAATR